MNHINVLYFLYVTIGGLILVAMLFRAGKKSEAIFALVVLLPAASGGLATAASIEVFPEPLLSLGQAISFGAIKDQTSQVIVGIAVSLSWLIYPVSRLFGRGRLSGQR